MPDVKKVTEVTPKFKAICPFISRSTAPKKTDFDKYYIDPEYKDVYRKAGVDADGEEYGVIETKVIERKRDIVEFVNQDRDKVGVEAYMRALAVQGSVISDFNTDVSESVQDFTDMPKDKFEGALYGDKAIEVFKNLDPELKGKHTTIVGFLNDLSQDKIDAYIKARVDATLPKVEKKEGE